MGLLNLRKQVIKTAYDFLSTKTNEHHIILFEKNKGEVGLFDLSQDSTIQSVDYCLESFLSVKKHLVGKVVFSAHNHPSGCNEPSMSDRFALNEFNSLLRLNNIHLIEEFIVTSTGVSSFKVFETDEQTLDCSSPVASLKNAKHYDSLRIERLLSYDKSYIEGLIKTKLLNGYQIAITNEQAFFSKDFSYEDMMLITKNVNEVVIWGFPRYQGTDIFKKIKDINTVFGSIECFSLDNQHHLLAMKKEMII